MRRSGERKTYEKQKANKIYKQKKAQQTFLGGATRLEATWRGLAGKFLKAAYLNRRGASLQSRLPQRKENKQQQKILGRKNKTRRRNRQGRERAKKDGPGREGPAGPAGPAGKKVTEGGERAESFFAEPFETPPPIRLLFLQGVRSGGAPTSPEETCLPACMHARTHALHPSIFGSLGSFREPKLWGASQELHACMCTRITARSGHVQPK